MQPSFSFSRPRGRAFLCRILWCLALGIMTGRSWAGTQDGPLKLEVMTAYNFVVDSNVESPSSVSPRVAHLAAKVTNTGSTTLTNVQVSIGTLIDAATSSGTQGVFPPRTVSETRYAGTFQLQMPGGSADAMRELPTLAPGQTTVQYFLVSYPLKDPLGRSVAGAAPVTEDDLWLNYDMWASASDGAATRRVDKRTKVTMRNEISAMANKIQPNTDAAVPDKYLNAIQNSLGWRPSTSNARVPGAIVTEGIWYNFGNVGAGFDNNGDGIPDRNAWMQPIGTLDNFNPAATRLVKCYGLVIVKLNDGTEQLIPFEDRLYFENLPANNTGAVGYVYYEYLPLVPGQSLVQTPYQEVASGYDNEKFNGDFGAGTTTVTTPPTQLAFSKAVSPGTVAPNATVTYEMSASNPGGTDIGQPSLGFPFMIEDAVPSGLTYVGASATATNSVPAGATLVVSWSTDNGSTWTTAEPAAASVNRIRWTLKDLPLQPTKTLVARYQAVVPSPSPKLSYDNVAAARLGGVGQLATASATFTVSGNNSLGDTLWRDDDRDGIKDGGEAGLANVSVAVYQDTNANSALDASDPLYATAQTDANGAYLVADMPDGRYIAVVDTADADLPTGCILPATQSSAVAVNLDASGASSLPVNLLTVDWPFITALEVVKSTTPTTYGAGDLVTYSIDLENHASSVPTKTPTVQTSWFTTVTSNRVAQNAANAQGAPNGVYGRVDYSANADDLTGSGLSFGTTTGTITKVEFVLANYVSAPFINDQAEININGTLFSTLTTAELNAMTGPVTVRSVDVTSLNASWTWSQVAALTGQIKAKKVSAGDPSIIWVDSLGVRVTTGSASTGTYSDSTIDPLPLQDTYDATKLQYVSASVAPTSVSAGTIAWTNVGPLNAGTRKTIEVTFRALTPPDTDSNGDPNVTTTVNTATSSGAYFVSGRPCNPDSGEVTVTINPRGFIGDLVWWDINANGSKDVSEPGIPGVLVTLSNGLQAQTDATGYYLFSGLADGSYTVTVDTTTLPWSSGNFTQTKDPDVTVNNASVVNINNNDGVSTNNSYLDRDFGYDSALNTISGSVFQDSNGDGILGTGESMLPGTVVTLLRDNDSNGSYETTVVTSATNSIGFYSFAALANGSYQVVVTPPSGTTQTLDPDATLNNATNEAASGGNLYADNDFAYRSTGALTLGDTLYMDWNGDGDQDSGEEGLPSVDVWLYEDTDGNGQVDAATDPLVSTAVTNATGVYGFSGLVSKRYVVVVNTADPQFPTGVVQVQDPDGTRDSRASVNLTVSLTTVDFGYRAQGTASIGDVVFIDGDGNGLHGAAEAGIPNVTVSLHEDTAGNGVLDAGTDALITTTTTGAAGSYSLTGLRAGTYLVVVDQNAAGIPTDGGGSKYRLTSSSPHAVSLSGGQVYTTADFGFSAPAGIGDFVYFDANGNGTQDYSETGIPNVTVDLYADMNQDGLPDTAPPLTSAVTADGSGAYPAGHYQFSNLNAGTYYVRVRASTLPQAGGQPIPQTSDPDRDGVPASDNTYPSLPAADHADSLVIVSQGASYLGADFGYQPPGAIGDFVWLDLDKDGVQDAGEPGIPNVVVTVKQGGTTYTATTDFDGNWTLSNVPDGAWVVAVAAVNFQAGGALENMAASHDADGGADSSVAMSLSGGVVNLAPGNLGFDFGYALNGAFAVSGTIATHDTGVPGTADDVDDFANDGVDQDAGPNDETELAGVTVYLQTVGGDFLGSTVTDAQGDYRFTGLPAGGYRVIMGTSTPMLFDSVLTTTATNHPAVTSVNSSSGSSVIQTLSLSANITDLDFTFVSLSSYDFGDLPLSYQMTRLQQDGARHVIPSSGSTVYLGAARDADTNGIATAQANGDDTMGSADEDGVLPVQPSTWTNGLVADGKGGSVEIAASGAAWLVGWIDWNRDGDFLDEGELIADQTVGTGTSTVAFGIPAGTLNPGSQSWLSRFRLSTARPVIPLFSYVGPTTDGEVEDHLISKVEGGSIGDFVWDDADGDGSADAGENGLGGVTVELRDSGNNVVATQTTGLGSTDVDGDGLVDPAGYYRFHGVPAGSYTVQVPTPPSGRSLSHDEDGTATANTTTVVLTTDEQHLTADFGYAPLVADVSGQVRTDADADGDFSDSDAGTSGVEIQLWTDPDEDGDPANGVQRATTTTDANGNYGFSDVPTGHYVIVEVNPAAAASTADVDGANDDQIAISMTGSDITGRDFLDALTSGTITGRVYLDTNGDGDQDSGESGLPNVTVKITDINGANQNVTTDGSGNWTASVPAGSTTVDVDNTDTDLPTNAVQTEGTDSNSVVAVANTSTSAGVDGFHVAATITGRVYLDTNGDGDQDAGESGLPNVTVNITDINGANQNVTTNGSGDWTASVPPGSTTVDVDNTDTDLPANAVQTEGTDPNSVVAVANASTSAGVDGLHVAATITGRVYLDTNGDGDQDSGESGLPNVTVKITDINGTNQNVTTNGTGDWTASVPPGSTTVDVDNTDTDLPTGAVQTEGTDPNSVATVANTSTSAGVDGFFVPATVTGHLYLDTNGDGDQDSGESGLPNVTVKITDINGANQNVTTNGTGDWTASVPPGSTTVDVDNTDTDLPTGAVQTEGTDPTSVVAVANTNTSAGVDGFFVPATVTGHLYLDTNGDGDQDAGEPNLPNVTVKITDINGTNQNVTTNGSGNWTVSVPPGETEANVDETDADFTAVVLSGFSQTEGTDPSKVTAVTSSSVSAGNDGYALPTSGLHRISGTVYSDSTTTNNNSFDTGDTPVAGVSVTLYRDANQDGVADVGELVTTTVTSTDGSYRFPAQPDGDYLVVEVNPTGAVSEADADGAANGLDLVAVDLAGADVTQVDFLDDVITYTITGKVTDGTAAISGVVVTLKDASGAVVATTVTRADGSYTFPNLPDGDYVVEETNPAGTAGGSDVDSGDPDRIAVRVAGSDVPARDFVDTIAASALHRVSGNVYEDSSNNSLIDVSDTPVGNVVVSLYADLDADGIADPGEFIGTTTTLGDGGYSFGRMPDGRYLVAQTVPAGAVSRWDADGTGNGHELIAVTLAGADVTARDFLDGGITMHNVSGKVTDGVDPFTGVVITLKNASNNVVAVTTTAPNGGYSFAALPDGDYTVEETNPAGTSGGSDVDGGSPDTISVSLAGSHVTARDFVDLVPGRMVCTYCRAVILINAAAELPSSSGGAWQVRSFTKPRCGTLVLNPDGRLRFTPTVDFYATVTDSFRVTLQDGAGSTVTRTVWIRSFESLSGTFQDYLLPPSDGLVSVSLTREATVSGKLVLGGKTYAFAGPLAGALGYTKKFTKPSGGSFTLTVNYDAVSDSFSVRLSETGVPDVVASIRRTDAKRRLVVNVTPTLGSVTAGFAPASVRTVGSICTITACPMAPTVTPVSPGTMFTRWSLQGSNVANGGIAFTPASIGVTDADLLKPTLAFVFREGLELTPHFAANRYTSLAGTYNGLAEPSATLPDRIPLGVVPGAEDGTTRTNATTGLLSVTVTTTGGFSAKLLLDGGTFTFTGCFDSAGVSRFGKGWDTVLSVVRTGKPSILISLELGTDVTGTVSLAAGSGVVAVSKVIAERAYYNGKDLIVGAAFLGAAGADGKFTTVLPARDVANQTAGFTAQEYPQGDGYGSITVNKCGVVTFVGKLADGTVVTNTGALSQANRFVQFAPLYNRLGFLSGLVTLDSTQASSDMGGMDLQWLRPALPSSQHYPLGWPEVISVDLLAAKYAAPVGQSALKAANRTDLPPVDADGNAELLFSDGRLRATVSKKVNISTKDVVTKLPPGDVSFTLRLDRATGQFTGNLTHSDGTAPAYTGVLYQKGPAAGGYGYFLTTTPKTLDHLGESGGVSLTDW